MSQYIYMHNDIEAAIWMPHQREDSPMENHTDNETVSPADRPLGFWLRTVDALIAREFDHVFADEGLTRRDWMLLSALSGTAPVPPAVSEKIARGGKRMRVLAERGWAIESDGEWTLTDDGREAAARLGERVAEIRSRTAGAVTPEEYATTVASLEAIAREYGWTEDMRMPRGRGFGFGRGRGFAPGREFWMRGLGHRGHGGHGHGHDHDHDHGGPAEHQGERGHGEAPRPPRPRMRPARTARPAPPPRARTPRIRRARRWLRSGLRARFRSRVHRRSARRSVTGIRRRLTLPRTPPWRPQRSPRRVKRRVHRGGGTPSSLGSSTSSP